MYYWCFAELKTDGKLFLSGNKKTIQDVVGHPHQFPAHSPCDEHQHRRQEDRYVRHDRHQGYRSSLRQPRPQEGKKACFNLSVSNLSIL